MKGPRVRWVWQKKIFLGVVSGLPRVINSRFNLSASLLYLQYSRGEPHFPISWKVSCSRRALLHLVSTRHLILTRVRRLVARVTLKGGLLLVPAC